jgi:transcriptional regulator with XRE-family HTH domain
MKIEPFVHRLIECIDEGPVSQVAIADYCGVSKQSVGNWKRRGYISSENLLKLSEVTGYRFLWLKNGDLPKKFDDPDENASEYRVEEGQAGYQAGTGSLGKSDEGKELIEAIAVAMASKQISPKAIGHLAAFFREIAKN